MVMKADEAAKLTFFMTFCLIEALRIDSSDPLE